MFPRLNPRRSQERISSVKVTGNLISLLCKGKVWRVSWWGTQERSCLNKESVRRSTTFYRTSTRQSSALLPECLVSAAFFDWSSQCWPDWTDVSESQWVEELCLSTSIIRMYSTRWMTAWVSHWVRSQGGKGGKMKLPWWSLFVTVGSESIITRQNLYLYNLIY